jgi:hypothetical protein
VVRRKFTRIRWQGSSDRLPGGLYAEQFLFKRSDSAVGVVAAVLELPLLRGVLELLLKRLDKSVLGREQFMEDESTSSRLRRNEGGLGRHRGLQQAGVVLPPSSLLYLLPPLVPPPISLAQVFRRVLVQPHRRPWWREMQG